MVNIILIGAPGSGKGTQSKMLEDHFGIIPISTGDILRNEVSKGTAIGRKVKNFMDTGSLVPDEIILNLVKNIISDDNNKNFALDGFPRNIDQCLSLDKMLKKVNKKIDIVLNIKVSDEIIIQRISGRFSCSNCNALYNKFFNKPKLEGVCNFCNSKRFTSRSDDNKKTVSSRLKIYNDKILGLINFYQKKNLIYNIDGLKDISLVSFEIKSLVSDFLK